MLKFWPSESFKTTCPKSFFFYIVLFCFGDRVLLCNQSWFDTHRSSPSSASLMLGSQTKTTTGFMPSLRLVHCTIPAAPHIWNISDLEVATAAAQVDQYYNLALLVRFPVNLLHHFLSVLHYCLIWAAKVFMTSVWPNKIICKPVLFSFPGNGLETKNQTIPLKTYLHSASMLSVH